MGETRDPSGDAGGTEPAIRRAYRPLRDPLFPVALAAYLVGRFVLRTRFDTPLIHSWWNDFLCIPLCVPVVTALRERLGLRVRGDPPGLGEVMIPLLLVGLTFEVWLPRAEWFPATTYADPHDILSYVLGALFAAIWWRAAYPETREPSATAGNQ